MANRYESYLNAWKANNPENAVGKYEPTFLKFEAARERIKTATLAGNNVNVFKDPYGGIDMRYTTDSGEVIEFLQSRISMGQVDGAAVWPSKDSWEKWAAPMSCNQYLYG